MDKNQFLKKLKKNLRFLSKPMQNEQLEYYENLDNYDLDPDDEANKIYKKLNYNIKVFNISFKDALLNIKESGDWIKIGLFFLYLLLLVILIKVPFIYIRDIGVSIMENRVDINKYYGLINLIVDILYSVFTIIIFVRLIKKKGYQFKKLNEKK